MKGDSMTEILLLISLAFNILVLRVYDLQMNKHKKALDETKKELEQNKKDIELIKRIKLKKSKKG